MSKLDLLRSVLLNERIRIVIDGLIPESDTVVIVSVSEALDGCRIVTVSIWAGYPFLRLNYKSDRVIEESVVLDAAYSLYSQLAFEMLRDQVRRVSSN